MESVARRLELLKLEGLSFSQAEIVKELSQTLGAFREETLSKLQYRHMKEDLEANRSPIHVHVEAEITKGKYHDYDTFLGAEAAQFLKLLFGSKKEGHDQNSA